MLKDTWFLKNDSLYIKKDVHERLFKMRFESPFKAYVLGANEKGVICCEEYIGTGMHSCQNGFDYDIVESISQKSIQIYKKGLIPVGTARTGRTLDRVGSFINYDYSQGIKNEGVILTYTQKGGNDEFYAYSSKTGRNSLDIVIVK